MDEGFHALTESILFACVKSNTSGKTIPYLAPRYLAPGYPFR